VEELTAERFGIRPMRGCEGLSGGVTIDT